MWYKGTEQECLAYDLQVTLAENYVENDNWSNSREIEGFWYVLKHENYTTQMELVTELPQVNEPII